METSSLDCVAEREGFEPSIRFCRILTFQASAFDHSATAPHFACRGAAGWLAKAGPDSGDPLIRAGRDAPYRASMGFARLGGVQLCAL